jgi:hypothetical protein
MYSFVTSRTGGAGTNEWLAASKNLIIVAYVSGDVGMTSAPINFDTRRSSNGAFIERFRNQYGTVLRDLAQR